MNNCNTERPLQTDTLKANACSYIKWELCSSYLHPQVDSAKKSYQKGLYKKVAFAPIIGAAPRLWLVTGTI